MLFVNHLKPYICNMKTKVAISVFACCLLAVFFIIGFKNSQNTILSKHIVNTALSNLDNPSLQQRVALKLF